MSDLIQPPESSEVENLKSSFVEDYPEVFQSQISCDPPNHPSFSKAGLELAKFSLYIHIVLIFFSYSGPSRILGSEGKQKTT